MLLTSDYNSDNNSDHSLHTIMNMNINDYDELMKTLSHCGSCDESICKYMQKFTHTITYFILPIIILNK